MKKPPAAAPAAAPAAQQFDSRTERARKNDAAEYAAAGAEVAQAQRDDARKREPSTLSHPDDMPSAAAAADGAVATAAAAARASASLPAAAACPLLALEIVQFTTGGFLSCGGYPRWRHRRARRLLPDISRGEAAAGTGAFPGHLEAACDANGVDLAHWSPGEERD